MTAEAALKLRRFVDFVNTFNISVISFVDEPGFMIGPDSENQIISTVPQLYQLCNCSPWASIIVRKFLV